MKYILEYPIPVDNDEGRYFVLSACEKAKYIYTILNKKGINVEIISPSYAKKTSFTRTDRINHSTVVVSGFSLGWRNSCSKVFSRISVMLWLLFFLIFKCRRKETILIYHGVQNIPIFLIAKWIKKFTYILEVEEIYSMLDLKGAAPWRIRLEEHMINNSDRYIFASKQLDKEYNITRRPSIIISGNYSIPSILRPKLNDGKIHIVYAGLIENEKVAFKSVDIANWLDSRYHIHIIGYGNTSDIELLKRKIHNKNSSGQCKVSYDGVKTGNEYISYLQQCHIGICPLTSDTRFQRACFPSKISSYLSNGLIVVTTKNRVLEESVYKDFLQFVENEDPANFAKVIKNIDFINMLNPRLCVMQEDIRVQREIDLLI